MLLALLTLTPIGLVYCTRSQSQAPHNASISRAEGRFWIDAELQTPIITIISAGIYSARQVSERQTDQLTFGMICIEELVKPECIPLPDFIMQLRTYTEMDCRNIMLQLASAIKTMHDAGMAHRNLNLENVIIDPLVRERSSDFIRPFVAKKTHLLHHFATNRVM